MKEVTLITDGSCLENPGPGGWACILRYGVKHKEIYGYHPAATNNRMEIMAAIQGLMALRERCEVTVVSDSSYVINGITKWVGGWKRKGWWRPEGPVPNADLWLQLDDVATRHQTKWTWTRGHAGHTDNERCDELAQAAARRQISSLAGNQMHLPLKHPWGYVPPKPGSSPL
ncbi:MAG: ribonuclease HI [Acidobacteria bacterium]|nr:ribonuclease HI [Acidobacteriota bacterium]